MLHLVVLQLGLRIIQFFFGGFHPLFQKFPGGGRFRMGQLGQPVQEPLHQQLVGFPGLFRAFAGNVHFQDFRILVGLGDDVALYVVFVPGVLAVFFLFGLFDYGNHHMTAFQNFRIGVHLLFGQLSIADGQLFHNGAGQASFLFDPQQGGGLVGVGDNEQIGHGQAQEATGDLGDGFLVGPDDLPQFPQIDFLFVQDGFSF